MWVALINSAFGQAKDIGCQIMEEDEGGIQASSDERTTHQYSAPVHLIDNSSAEVLSQKICGLLNLT